MRNVIELSVGVVDDHRALAEIGAEKVVDVFVYGSGKGWPHAAQQDLIQQGRAALTGKGTNVGLQIGADSEQEVAVPRLDREPAGADGDQTHFVRRDSRNRTSGDSRIGRTLRAGLFDWRWR